MKVNFVLASYNLSGGNKVAAIHANWLATRGHEVTVAASRRKPPNLRKRIFSALCGGLSDRASNQTHFQPGRARLIELDESRPVGDADVPDADVVIASWWEAIEWVKDLAPAKGKKVSFLQHYEIHEHLPQERVRAVWRLPAQKIVVSRWLQQIAESEFGDFSSVLVPNGVDTNRFHAEPRDKNETPTVGLMYSRKPFKRCGLSLEAVAKAREVLPDLRLVAFGAEPPTRSLPLPRDVEFHLAPPQTELCRLYAKCDAWLVGSRTEGFGLPILEAMACRTPVISTPAGAAPELLGAGGGILVPGDSPDAMAEAIVTVLTSPNEHWRGLSEQAAAIAAANNWENSCRLMEQALLAVMDS